MDQKARIDQGARGRTSQDASSVEMGQRDADGDNQNDANYREPSLTPDRTERRRPTSDSPPTLTPSRSPTRCVGLPSRVELLLIPDRLHLKYSLAVTIGSPGSSVDARAASGGRGVVYAATFSRHGSCPWFARWLLLATSHDGSAGWDESLMICPTMLLPLNGLNSF